MDIGYIFGFNLDIPVWILLLLMSICLYYIYMTWPYSTFKEMGISGPQPIVGLGNFHQLLKKGFLQFELDCKKQYGNVYGLFLGRQPQLVVHDLDVLRQVLVKEFPNFQNTLVRDLMHPSDPFSHLLTVLRDDHWKHVRNTLSPSFSAGKLKMMNKQINWCADQLVSHIGESCKLDSAFELKQLTGEYAMDTIASTGFGLQLDSHQNPDNPFIIYSKKVLKVTVENPRILVLMFFPFLRNLTKKMLPLFPSDITRFFLKMTTDILTERKNAKAKANMDFMQLMADQHVEDSDESNVTGKNGLVWNKSGLTTLDIVGTLTIFLLAGYDTTANTLCFVLYNLAVYQECQDRLIKEIDEHLQGKEPRYEDLVELPYLQQVIDETLRLYPPAPRADRAVGEDMTINGLSFRKGLLVGIPIYALQMDPEVWPEPEKFDPDRFTAEKKASRDPLQYMPFGYGPRNCIGMRLALMEMKIAIIKVLQKYRLVTCDKTQIPLAIDKLRILPKDGAWIKAEKRTF